jgi:hypothetical protein
MDSMGPGPPQHLNKPATPGSAFVDLVHQQQQQQPMSAYISSAGVVNPASSYMPIRSTASCYSSSIANCPPQMPMQNGSPDNFASRAMPPTYFYPSQFGGPSGPGGYGGPMPGAPNHFIGYHQGPSSPREGTCCISRRPARSQGII